MVGVGGGQSGRRAGLSLGFGLLHKGGHFGGEAEEDSDSGVLLGKIPPQRTLPDAMHAKGDRGPLLPHHYHFSKEA